MSKLQKVIILVVLLLVAIDMSVFNFYKSGSLLFTLPQAIFLEILISIYLVFFVYKPLEDTINVNSEKKRKIIIPIMVIRCIVLLIGDLVLPTIVAIDLLLILMKEYVLLPVINERIISINYSTMRKIDMKKSVEALKNKGSFDEFTQEASVEQKYLLPEKTVLINFIKEIMKAEGINNSEIEKKLIENVRKLAIKNPNEKIKDIVYEEYAKLKK